MKKRAPLNDCWAFVDGTSRTMSRPDEKQRIASNGHKRVHFLQYQSPLMKHLIT